ncbi:MAG: hypothetical protein H6573_26525 [Lewinellaceae bacterium]|nr:hypothetical protein [Phaeodactylibacter sp.]MCB9351028.1 hypothetical protein [Lewinellaceae bacterium]
MAFNAILSNCLLLSIFLSTPILGILNPFHLLSNTQKWNSQGFPESCDMPVSDHSIQDSLDLLCRPGMAVALTAIDTDGDGIPDETGRLEAAILVDTLLAPCANLVFSINKEGEGASIEAEGLPLTCEDLGVLIVEVHAWCEGEILASCLTYILVSEGSVLCEQFPLFLSVDGRVIREDGVPIEDVQVNLSSPTSSSVFTNVQGSYSFFGLSEGDSIRITPEINSSYTENVSTQDLVLISRHILGVQPLGSPYKMIAADVNNSKSITTLDLIMLRRLLLGMDIEFEANTSWRFVRLDYAFPEPSNPWAEPFPERIDINGLPAAGAQNLDFVAVKVGDVSLD